MFEGLNLSEIHSVQIMGAGSRRPASRLGVGLLEANLGLSATEPKRGRLPTKMLAAFQRERRRHFFSEAGEFGTLIASYNVHKCVGTDNRFDPDRVTKVIGEIGADLIALQEATRRFGERRPLVDLIELQRSHGLTPVPTAGEGAVHGWHGNLLLLREGAVRDVRNIRLPGVEPRGALVVDVDLKSGPLRVVAAHLGLLRRSRAQQAEAILAAVGDAAERPTLLLGDLNEWRVGRRSSLLGLNPAFGPLTAALPSFPSRFPIFALDRILGCPHSLISSIEVHDTALARVASDHLPIKARVDFGCATVGTSPTARIAA